MPIGVGKTVRGGASGTSHRRAKSEWVSSPVQSQVMRVAVGAGVLEALFRGSWGVMAGATVGISIGVGSRGGIVVKAGSNHR